VIACATPANTSDFPAPSLALLVQAGILQREGGLIGERLQELNLPVGEGADVIANT